MFVAFLKQKTELGYNSSLSLMIEYCFLGTLFANPHTDLCEL